jgi:hypothetical protein
MAVRFPRHAVKHNRLESCMTHPSVEVFLATEECCWDILESLHCSATGCTFQFVRISTMYDL